MDTGEPLAAIRDRILSANAYIGAFPLAEALATGARRGDRRPLHRYRADAGAHGPPLRLAAGRLRQAGRRHHRRPHHRMRRAVAPAATARWTGRPFPTWRTSATRSWKPSPTAPSRVTKHAGSRRARQHPHREGAAALRTGRPAALHHARLRGRFHQHPPGRCRPRPRARQRHSRRPAAAHAEAFHQLRQRMEGHRHAGLLAGRRRSKRRAPPTASCASGCADLGLAFDEIYTEYFGVERLPRPGGAAQSRSARSAVAHRRARRRTARRWTASRAS